jgi:hypothetical protein
MGWKHDALNQNRCHNRCFYKWWNVIESYMVIVLKPLWFGLKYG